VNDVPRDTYPTVSVKDSLIADFVKVDDANQAAAIGLPSPFWSLTWDFVLARTDQVGRSRA
jgi:catechol 1,2-dioxygenase